MRLSRRYFLAFTAAAAIPARAADVPRPSPDFSINMPDGSKLPLKSFRKKVVVMTFINTTWPHCQHIAQVLGDIQKQYGPKGVQVLMSAMDPNGAASLPPFLNMIHPPYPVGFNNFVDALGYMQVPVLTPGFVPKMAFIDREGVIREQHGGEEAYFKTPEASIRNSLDELLKPAPSAKKGAKRSRPKK